MPQIGKRYVVRLRVTDEQPLQYVERLVHEMTHGLSVHSRPDLDQSQSERKTKPKNKTHTSRPTLEHGEAVVLHKSFLHGQH